MEAAPLESREPSCGELMAGSQVWAPRGGAWRHAFVTGLVKNRSDFTVVHLSLRTQAGAAPVTYRTSIGLSRRYREQGQS
jgi:hypothetical protein